MALHMLDGLQRQNYNVHLITLDGTYEVPLHGDPQRAEELSRHLIRLSRCQSERNTLNKIISAPYQWLKLHRTLRRLQCNTVISFMERANIFNLTSVKKTRRIISIRKHLSMAMRNKSALKRGLIKTLYPLLLKRADIINFNAYQSAENFRNLFSVPSEKISVINNYCNLEVLEQLSQDPIPSEYEAIFQQPVIITSGRLLEVKGHAHLIRAFREVKKNISPDCQLIILGEGPLRENLTALCRELQVNDTVHLPGYQKNPYAWLAKSDLFVLPSLAEGFPNALLEAMAIGLPVISADCPSGPRELLGSPEILNRKINDIFDADYGILIPRLDLPEKTGDESITATEKILTQAIAHLLRDSEKRFYYARQAKARAKSYSFESFFEKWSLIISG